MSRTAILFFAAIAASTAVSLTACSSGGDNKVGSSDQELKKKTDGGATGNGTTCSWDDSVSYDPATGKETVTPSGNGYKIGDSFPSEDGCNTCSCTAQGILCTLRACAPSGTCTVNSKTYNAGQSFPSPDGCNTCWCQNDGTAPCTEMACTPSGGTCTVNGKTYNAGQSFPSPDGCNTCSCQNDGTAACTEMACAPVTNDCKKTGCSGEVCADQDMASACIWAEHFACYQSATCARQTDGKCGFTQTPELTSCIASKQ